MRYLFAVVFFAYSSVLFSHGGGLDRYGCHKETKTGGYHCHRSSGWGGSLPSIGNTYGQGIQDEIKQSWSDDEFYDGEIKIKNFGCYSVSGLKMEVINKSSKNYKVSFDIVMSDKDSDPILNWSDNVYVESMSRTSTSYRASDQLSRNEFAEKLFRREITTNLYGNFSCPDSIHFRKIRNVTRVES